MDPLNEMAYSRDDYKLRVRQNLSGALGEFIKHKLAEKNGLAMHKKNGHLVHHWHEEAIRLLDNNVLDALLTQVKFGHDKQRKAALEALDERMQQSTDPLERRAKGKLEKIFGHRCAKKKIVPSDLDEFWAEARETIDSALPDPEDL